MTLDWLLCLSGMLPSESFAISENCLALRGAVSPLPTLARKVFKMSNHHNIQKIKNNKPRVLASTIF